MLPYCDTTSIKTTYFAYFHSLLEYGIAFWGNSTGNKKVFKLQKRAIRLMTGSKSRTSCQPLFPQLGILTLSSQYIFSLMRFLTQNLELYTTNSTIHNHNTRSRIQLHKPSATLALYQKGPYYESIRVYNALPHNIAELILQKKEFITKLKKYLLAKAYYSVEYMNDHTGRQDEK